MDASPQVDQAFGQEDCIQVDHRAPAMPPRTEEEVGPSTRQEASTRDGPAVDQAGILAEDTTCSAVVAAQARGWSRPAVLAR